MAGKLYSAVVRVDRWLRARFTPTGRVLLSALVAVGLFALNPRATLAYQLALLIFAALVAAMLWAPAFRPRLRARRRLPKFATAGVPLAYTLEIENLKQRPLFDLEATDEPLAVNSAQVISQARNDRAAPDPERSQKWRRRGVGYMRFVRALRGLEGVRCDASNIAQLAPQAVTRVPMSMTPTRRGNLTLSRLRVTHADPLGVFRAAARLALSDRLLVLPRRYRVSWNAAGQSSRHARYGTVRSRACGSGADFARLREYRPRDSLRHIHWRAWARLGEPVVKEFHEESPSRSALVLDVCAPAGMSADTFEEAVSVAASFVSARGWCEGQLDLLIAGEHQVRVAAGNEGEGTVRMLEALASVHASRADDFATVGRGLARGLAHFGTCVLVLLDLDEPRSGLVHNLQRRGVATLVLVISELPAQRFEQAARALPHPQDLHVLHPSQIAVSLAALSSHGSARD